MVFNNNINNTRKAGVIRGNPLNGLNERACIQCDKILDMGIKRYTLTGQEVTIDNISPANLTAPYTFISATYSNAYIENLQVTRIANNPCYAQVSGNLVIELDVALRDSNSQDATASTSISIPKDIILCIGEEALVNYTIGTNVSVVVTSGEFSTTTVDSLTLNLCVTSIIKSLIPVELVIPTYGYSFIPDEVEANTVSSCQGVFDLPLYPNACYCNPNCATSNNNVNTGSSVPWMANNNILNRNT